MNTRFTSFFAFALLLAACNSTSLDQSLLGQMTSTAVQLEELLGQSELSGGQLAKFKAALDRTPEALKTDTAFLFGAIQENFLMLAGRQTAVNSQLSDMKNRLAELNENYSSGKIKTEAAQADFSNFDSSLSNVSEAIQGFDTDFGQLQTDFGKMMAAFHMKKEEADAENSANPPKK